MLGDPLGACEGDALGDALGADDGISPSSEGNVPVRLKLPIGACIYGGSSRTWAVLLDFHGEPWLEEKDGGWELASLLAMVAAAAAMSAAVSPRAPPTLPPPTTPPSPPAAAPPFRWNVEASCDDAALPASLSRFSSHLLGLRGFFFGLPASSAVTAVTVRRPPQPQPPQRRATVGLRMVVSRGRCQLEGCTKAARGGTDHCKARGGGWQHEDCPT